MPMVSVVALKYCVLDADDGLDGCCCCRSSSSSCWLLLLLVVVVVLLLVLAGGVNIKLEGSMVVTMGSLSARDGATRSAAVGSMPTECALSSASI